MHILMISDVFFPRINGVSTSIEGFRRELLELGHRVTLVCPGYPEDQPGTGTIDLGDDGVVRVASRRAPLDPEDRLMHWGDLMRRLSSLTATDIDLVHVHTPFIAHYAGRRFARRLGVPVVETYHTFFEEYADKYVPWLPSGWLRRIARAWSRAQCNGVDRLIVPSVPMKAALVTYGVRTRMTVIPTGLPLAEPASTADAAEFRAANAIPADAPLLLYVGRVAREKNIDVLVEMLPAVLESHPDTVLLIAGEGPARVALAERVRSMGLDASIRFLGYLCRKTELPAAYRAADLFVFASTSETQGLVLLEALAQGTPVIAVAEMGTRDVLHADGGCRIVANDPAAFAEATQNLLADPDQRERLASAARSYAKRWSIGAMTERLLTVYHELSLSAASAPTRRG
ncbi:MAG: glycosyltransferase [Halothiobacillaceae bacterium]|nr:glycosyltransferase [Halothiobacillaceae bacterium]HER34223.1 glycosyltransferase family 4 protein [Halothiobacillaceae bacterium]